MTKRWVRTYTIGTDHVPMPCFNTLAWARWLEANPTASRVAEDRRDNYWVSTVFLAIDHNWSAGGDPLLFETMVFFDDGDLGQMDRYRTWAEAVAGHERIRAMLACESANAEQMTMAALRALLAAATQAAPAEKDETP